MAVEYCLNRFSSGITKVFNFLHISVHDGTVTSWINFQISQVSYDINPYVYCNFDKLKTFLISLYLTLSFSHYNKINCIRHDHSQVLLYHSVL